MAKGKLWTERDTLFLKDNYSKVDIQELALELNRSIMSLKMHVSRQKMKLKRYKIQCDNDLRSNNDLRSKAKAIFSDYIDKIALDILEILKEHDSLNMYKLQRVFHSKYSFHTEYSVNKALKNLVKENLVEYVSAKNNKSKNFRLKD